MTARKIRIKDCLDVWFGGMEFGCVCYAYLSKRFETNKTKNKGIRVRGYKGIRVSLVEMPVGFPLGAFGLLRIFWLRTRFSRSDWLVRTYF